MFRPAGLQMVWEKGIQDYLGLVPLAGLTVLLQYTQNVLQTGSSSREWVWYINLQRLVMMLAGHNNIVMPEGLI